VPNDLTIGQQPCALYLTHAIQGIPHGTAIHRLTPECGGSIYNGALSDAHVQNTSRPAGGDRNPMIPSPAAVHHDRRLP